jgi:hypothetical protein
MSEPTYPAARLIADKVQAHYTQHQRAAAAAGRSPLAPVPEPGVIEHMIDTAFWASLRREEGQEPRISLAYVPSELAGQPLHFASPLPLRPAALARLAPAVERAGIHLGVWQNQDRLEVWGTTRNLPDVCFVIEVVASGLLVIKQSGEPFGKFLNVAVIEGDTVKFVDEERAFVPGCPAVVKSLLGRETPSSQNDGSGLLVQVAASMRRHGRGGALLVVPHGTTAWGESIVSPMLYGLEPAFSELSSLLTRGDLDRAGHDWQDSLRQVVEAVGGLTAVDGVTIISSHYDVLAFGAKITRRRGSPSVERVVSTEPIEGAATTYISPSQLGGTRHLSAAQFVHDQRDAVALVASQDGRFTIFQWSSQESLVHAHHVEALLL